MEAQITINGKSIPSEWKPWNEHVAEKNRKRIHWLNESHRRGAQISF